MTHDLLVYLPWAITAAAAAASVLPPGKPGTVWGVAHQTINMLAFNFGRAENRDRFRQP